MENETDSFNFPHLFFSTSIYSLVDDVDCSRGMRIFCEYLQRSHGYRCCNSIPHLGNQNWDWIFLWRFYSNTASSRHDELGISHFVDNTHTIISGISGWAQYNKWVSTTKSLSTHPFHYVIPLSRGE